MMTESENDSMEPCVVPNVASVDSSCRFPPIPRTSPRLPSVLDRITDGSRASSGSLVATPDLHDADSCWSGYVARSSRHPNTGCKTDPFDCHLGADAVFTATPPYLDRGLIFDTGHHDTNRASALTHSTWYLPGYRHWVPPEYVVPSSQWKSHTLGEPAAVVYKPEDIPSKNSQADRGRCTPGYPLVHHDLEFLYTDAHSGNYWNSHYFKSNYPYNNWYPSSHDSLSGQHQRASYWNLQAAGYGANVTEQGCVTTSTRLDDRWILTPKAEERFSEPCKYASASMTKNNTNNNKNKAVSPLKTKIPTSSALVTHPGGLPLPTGFTLPAVKG